MIFCVTGPMAAGKNAASDILSTMGFACVDADILTHKAIENSREAILDAFGGIAAQNNISLTSADGSIDRRNLGALIFRDASLLRKQESIVYPEVNRLFDDFVKEHSQKDIVLNATVLYKVPLIKKVDFIIYVDAPVVLRYFRAKKRDNMKPSQILDRFKRQKNLFSKYKNCNADNVRVWNTGSRKSLEKKLVKILRNAGRG